MNLLYLSGDRTAALRQFERCSAALREELGVEPDKLTSALYQKIRADRAEATPSAPAEGAGGTVSLADVLGHLKQIQKILTELQSRVQKDTGPTS
jgi:DNA-binding SARP family transcriptional activator